MTTANPGYPHGSPYYREGFLFTAVDKAFPGLRRKNPTAFSDDVRLLYEWSYMHPHASRLDPLDLKKHGQYKNEQAALRATEHYLDAPRQSRLHDLMAGGFTDMAAQSLGIANFDKGPTMPADIKDGKLVAKDVMPSTGQLLWDTAKALPKATVHDAGKVAHGAGSLFGGIFKSPVVLILLVVVLVVLVKAK